MLCILSPAKTFQALSPPVTLPEMTRPALLPHTQTLLQTLAPMTAQQLATLMHLSPALAERNTQRYHQWDSAEEVHALWRYHGDVYKGLKHTPLSATNWQHANDHIAVISGLYGLLRATDAVREHRLEMGTKLVTPTAQNLYSFWGTHITDQLNERIAAAGAQWVLNLASKEYAKAIKPAALTVPVVTAQFLEHGPKGYRTVAIYAKRARGLMARFVLDQQITTPAQLLDFAQEGYAFCPQRSDETTVVFTRNKDHLTVG